MGILYEQMGLNGFVICLFVLFTLMAFNEFGRSTKWGGITLFVILPVILTIFVWPTTAAPGNEYGTGTWFNWVKTYSALAGCVWFMALRYIPKLREKKWALALPAIILAVNILEASIRDFQCFSYGAWDGAVIDHLWVMSGPWNIMNGIAGILNVITICGWTGIFIAKNETKDMIWPDMIWAWILAYDIWNFAYTYNCISDHSIYCGLILILSCTIPAFWIKRGAWLQHRAHTLALWIMFVMTVPQFADRIAPISTTHNPVAFFTLSLISLLVNIALVVYQFNRVRKYKFNVLKDELYKDTKDYKALIEANK